MKGISIVLIKIKSFNGRGKYQSKILFRTKKYFSQLYIITYIILYIIFNVVLSPRSVIALVSCKIQSRNSWKHDKPLIGKWGPLIANKLDVIVRCGNYLFRLRILSACGLLIYCSTICFQRRRHSQPLKKLWTFLIFCISIEPSAIPCNPGASAYASWAPPKHWVPQYKLPVPWDIVLWTPGRLRNTGVMEGLSSFFRAHNYNITITKSHIK